MTEFTKGPWTTTKKRPRRIVRDGGKMIATAVLHNGAGGKKDVHKSIKEAEANAHLIASAPDLYEALENACKVLEILANPKDEEATQLSSHTLWAQCIETASKGYAALSKAIPNTPEKEL